MAAAREKEALALKKRGGESTMRAGIKAVVRRVAKVVTAALPVEFCTGIS